MANSSKSEFYGTKFRLLCNFRNADGLIGQVLKERGSGSNVSEVNRLGFQLYLSWWPVVYDSTWEKKFATSSCRVIWWLFRRFWVWASVQRIFEVGTVSGVLGRESAASGFRNLGNSRGSRQWLTLRESGLTWYAIIGVFNLMENILPLYPACTMMTLEEVSDLGITSYESRVWIKGVVEKSNLIENIFSANPKPMLMTR